MSRRLILMRHGKSAWDTDAPSDHLRPLSPRGRREVPLVGGRLLELGWRPDQVISSDATRTRETYQALLAVLAPPPPVEYRRALYLPSVEAVRTAVAAVDPGVHCLLLLGHNPGFEEALAWLGGIHETLKTSSAALLEAPGDDWAGAVVAPAGFQLVTVIRAKELC